MKKLSYEVLEKVKKDNLTRKEIDFLLYISKYQNNMGIVDRIYYKNVCNAIKISHQCFYNIISSLEEKNILRATKNNLDPDKYWSFFIYNNQFTNNKDFKKGYISTNYKIFSSDEFLNLKKLEKVLIIELIKRFGYTKRHSLKWSILKIKKFLDLRYDREVLIVIKAIEPLLKEYLVKIDVSRKNVFSFEKGVIDMDIEIEEDMDSVNHIERLIEKNKIETNKEEKTGLLKLFKHNFKKRKDKLKHIIDLVLEIKGTVELKLINTLMNLKKPFEEIYNGYNI